MSKRALTAVLTAAALLGLPGSAAAEPVTYESGNGATATLSSGAFAPGDRIEVSGTGFAGNGGSGHPVIAIKLNDGDDPLAFGGADAIDEVEPGLPSFEARSDGTFSGWVDLPDDLPTDGPGTGPWDGAHWLRILSGAFSTGDNYTDPITFRAYFRAEPLTLGYTNTADTPEFFPGNVVPATASSLTAKGLGFDAGEAVTVELDGAAVTASGATAEAGGDFTATVSIPAGLTAGAHTLAFETSTVSREVTLQVVPHSATLVTPAVRPGRTVVVDVAGFRSISGAGQKVALNLAGTGVIACVQTDATGSARISATVPAAAPEGSASLTALAGRECVVTPPPIVTEPLPRVGPNTLSVSATAPEASTPFVRGSAGGSIPVAGSGFGSGEAIAVALDGVAAGGGLTAAADGTFSGSVPIPAGTAPGARLLTFTSASAKAALTFEAVAGPTATVTTTGPLHPGSTVAFALTGFGRGDGTAGQKVAVKIDSGAVVACLDDLDASGKGSGSIVLPGDLALGAHTLRFLAGTSCVSAGPQNDLPARSVAAAIQVVAVPAGPGPGGGGTPGGQQPGGTTPPPGTGPPGVVTAVPKASSVKLTGKRSKLRIKFAAALPAKARVTVRTAAKVRLKAGAKKRIVTLARLTSAKGGKTLTLKLTGYGRRLLKRLGRVKLVVTVARPGGGTSRRTFTLKVR